MVFVVNLRKRAFWGGPTEALVDQVWSVEMLKVFMKPALTEKLVRFLGLLTGGSSFSESGTLKSTPRNSVFLQSRGSKLTPGTFGVC